jgi:hypothetical protein
MKTTTQLTEALEHKTVARGLAAYDSAQDPSALEIVPDTWNVLPRGASRDEVDVHWFFNWSEGDMTPRPLLNPWERGCIGKRVKTNDRTEICELPGVRRAAARSSRVRRVLVALDPVHASALARWSAPPNRYPDAVRASFGRLSAVAALTEAFEEIGGTTPFVRACERAAGPRTKDGAENFLRHHAKVKVDVIRAQAEALLAAAFEAYRVERAKVDAESRRVAERRERDRAPAINAIVTAANGNDGGVDGKTAMAILMAEGSR